MTNLDFFLSLVTSPAILPSEDFRAFPGCEMKAVDQIVLPNAFELGDFMNDSNISVAEEVSLIDVSVASAAPHKAQHVVWRVAMKSGPVAFMQLRVTGIEGSDTADLIINGRGTVIDDAALAPFVQALMVESSRCQAFEEIEELVCDAARLAKQAQAMFSSSETLACQANERLVKASTIV